MRDIAERAGVSIATVSRVLNGRPDVSAATRASVLQSVREIGYVSNRVARASWETGLIALSLPALRGDDHTQIVAGAVEALHERDARLVICATGRQPAVDGSLRERLLQGITDGALLIAPQEPEGDLAMLQQSGFPFVVIDPVVPAPERIPVVASANWAGAKLATEHLIALGHTHIGIITGPPDHAASIDRLAGYQAALLAAGLPLVPALVERAEPSIEGGACAAERLLARPHAPSAIFAISDALAFGALRAARARQVRVPADLSLVGFGDVELAALMTPPLTTVQQPFQGLGRLAVDVLYRLLQGQPLPATRVELSTALVQRDSTASPQATSFLTY